MKLVELLAKELAEWPECINKFTCDPNGEIRGAPMTAYDFYPVGHVDLDQRTKNLAGLGDDLPFVDRAQWQAERDRQKGGEWKRHRGGKQPVFEGKVEVKFRDGDIEEWFSHSLDWSHNGKGRDIMQYRIISQPQAEEVEVRKFTQDLNMHTPQGEFIRGPISLNDEVIYPAEAQWQQSTGPLAWRDTIIHCQAFIEDCEREIQRNMDLLDAEGLMMQTDSKKAMQHYVPQVDLLDWNNWQNGDILEIVANEGGHEFEIGNKVTVIGIDRDDSKYRIEADHPERGDWWLRKDDAIFIARP